MNERSLEMADYPGLMRRGGTYQLRVRVPLDIVRTFGKKEVWRSLKTKNRKEAIARWHVERKRVDDEFKTFRTPPSALDKTVQCQAPKPMPSCKPITLGTLTKLCDAFYTRIVDEDFAWRSTILPKVHADIDGFFQSKYIPQPESEFYQFIWEEMTPDECLLFCIQEVRQERLKDFQQKLVLGDTSIHMGRADKLLAEHDLICSEPDKLRLVRKLMVTEIRALEDILKEDQTRYDDILEKYGSVELKSDATVAATQPNGSVQPAVKPGPLLSSLMSGFKDEGKREGLANKTTRGDQTDLREFIAVAGDKPVRHYTRDDGVKFKETLIATPSNRDADSFKKLNIFECAKKADDIDPDRTTITRLAISTINDKLMAVGKFFGWVNAHHRNVENPTEGLRIKDKRARGKKIKARFPFTIDELQRLFDGPIYRGCKSRTRWKQPGTLIERDSARYWAPLIALYSGMRLGEIIQMRVADIKTDGDGITYFDITTAVEAGDAAAEKSLKTSSSVRQIPVHPELFKFGLTKLIEQRQQEGSPRLLMDYDISSVDESWSKTFSAWFRHYRKHIGVRRIVNGKDRVCFHSFRHLFEDIARDLPGVKKEVRDALQGHGENGVSAEYGTGVYRKRLNEAVQKLEFTGLDLSHLRTASKKR